MTRPLVSVSTRRRRGELREQLIDSALAELAAPEDPEALSLRRVAKRAGVTPPAVYLYFPNRQALVVAVLERLFGEMTEACESAAARHRLPRRRLLARGRAYGDYGLANPGHYKVMYEGKALAELSDPAILGLGAPILTGVLDDLHDMGIDEPDARQRAVLLWQITHGAVSLRINKPSFPWPPLATDLEYAFKQLL